MSTPALADGLPDPAPVEAPATPVTPDPNQSFTHLVAAGDTLYGIAVDLGVCTPDEDPKSCWVELYEQNVDVIGGNPDLILPGQSLSYVGGLLLPSGAPAVVVEEQPEEQVAPARGSVQFGTAIIANSAGPVAPGTQEAADSTFANVPGASLITIGGTRASAIDPHGHPSGHALDYMVLGDSALGDAIVQYQIDHWDSLGVEYVIWQQRILLSPGASWKPMENRGSRTQNHMDHVHVNYR
jgi:hypothetical protein